MFGHRADGHLVKKIDPIIAFTPYAMPMRCDAQVMLDYKLDFEKLARYIAQKSQEGFKITFMELVIAAYVRTVSQMPQINRFIANKRLYCRNNLSVAFALLRNSSSEEIAENTTKCFFDPSDTIFDVAERIRQTIAEGRAEEAENATFKLAKLLTKPILANTVIIIARFLDRYGLLPRALIDAIPFHTSMFITNLASIGLPAVHHHIYNFGTCSQFISIGSVERTVALDAQGNAVRKRLLPMGVVTDERICEGATYARMLSIMSKLLNNPEQLEVPPTQVFYDEGHEYHLPKPEPKVSKKPHGASVQA